MNEEISKENRRVLACFEGIDFSQDTGPLIKSFFPRTELVVRPEESTGAARGTQETDGTDMAEQTGFDAVLTFRTQPESFAISFDGEPYCNEKVVFSAIEEKEKNADNINDKGLSDGCRMSVEKLRHRDYRNQLLRALYRMLSEKTGKTLPWGILTGVRPTKLCFERLEKNMIGNISFMKDTYYCSPKKAGIAQMIAGRELQLLRNMDYKNGYSLYVGFPFCPSICNYCSFGSHPIGRFSELVEPYIEALLKEIDGCCGLISDKRLQTVYFGGGTPTAVSCEQLQRVIRRVKERFDFSDVSEFTVEAGRPDSIDIEKLQMLKSEGVTRISINPQSMRQKTLDIIGRKHTVEQTAEAFRMAREVGFDNINMDLIAGLSGECLEDMKYTLEEVGKLDPDSITVHTLALKRAARLSTEKESFAGLEAREVPEMVECAADFCMERGYNPYYLYRQKNMTENLENVGYARQGKEGLYNILIMEEQQMILALGAGASSKFTDYRYFEEKRESGRRFGRVENVKNVREYIERIDEMIRRKFEFMGK